MTLLEVFHLRPQLEVQPDMSRLIASEKAELLGSMLCSHCGLVIHDHSIPAPESVLGMQKSFITGCPEGSLRLTNIISLCPEYVTTMRSHTH